MSGIKPQPTAHVFGEGRRQVRESEGMTEPMYRQIAEDLRARIESGAIAQGAKLPTESDLRVGYGAARNTVRDAVKLLASRGLVETRPGLGTFVTRHVEPFVTTLAAAPLPAAHESMLKGGMGEDEGFAGIRAQGRTPSVSGPQVIVQPAPDDIAVRLRVPAGTQVVGRRRERYIDGRPWSLRTSYYPFEFVTRGATDLVRAEGLRTSYRSVGHELAPFRVRVTVLPAGRVVLVINSGAVPADHAVPAVA
jgi:GntR family transcriptional regulator